MIQLTEQNLYQVNCLVLHRRDSKANSCIKITRHISCKNEIHRMQHPQAFGKQSSISLVKPGNIATDGLFFGNRNVTLALKITKKNTILELE